MSSASPFIAAPSYVAAELVEAQGVQLASSFGASAGEYRAAREALALFDRSDRGLLAATGSERRDWLHNLVTAAVATLADDAGTYAFAINVKGRILFDLNVLNLTDTLWLDVPLPAVAAASAHLDRYLFTEDVRLQDATGEYARLGCSGPQAAQAAGALGVNDLSGLPALSSRALSDGPGRLVRHDFAGPLGFELYVPRGEASGWWERIVRLGGRPAGSRALDVLRIEAGIAWLGRDLDEQVLPPETGAGARGVSCEKGCYLGQEVLERMRSRGALARRLVRVRVGDGGGVELPAAIVRDGAEVGRVTSLVPHVAAPYWVGLGFLRTTVAGTEGLTVGAPPRELVIV